ncbi:PLDc N-terminal domain-containing protein [Marinobacterium sediminicola]|uniref:Phospholipase_D-nuclease N-terminal n=1 Tax=Marinobacterium sediminicola TaxID=518898 RepID=A0ABY1RXF4_9GAMM|nr:PLDc N-terminal domain-containing protein [Marinobacterium sediminicola]SMR71588.1 Phospholipase_D-nuclease N-terminal [Marinobacterium sediminicola]
MLSVEVSGLFGLIILVLDVMAIIKTVQSRASTGAKVMWVVAILLLPVLGLILWFLFGPRD